MSYMFTDTPHVPIQHGNEVYVVYPSGVERKCIFRCNKFMAWDGKIESLPNIVSRLNLGLCNEGVGLWMIHYALSPKLYYPNLNRESGRPWIDNLPPVMDPCSGFNHRSIPYRREDERRWDEATQSYQPRPFVVHQCRCDECAPHTATHRLPMRSSEVKTNREMEAFCDQHIRRLATVADEVALSPREEELLRHVEAWFDRLREAPEEQDALAALHAWITQQRHSWKEIQAYCEHHALSRVDAFVRGAPSTGEEIALRRSERIQRRKMINT